MKFGLHNNTENEDASNDNLQIFPISNDVLHKLLQEDVFCKTILNQIEKGNIVEGQLYLVRDKILKMYILDGDNTYETTAQILRMAHNELGHNRTNRTYTLLKRLYYLKGLNQVSKNTLRSGTNVKEEISK